MIKVRENNCTYFQIVTKITSPHLPSPNRVDEKRNGFPPYW